MSTPPYKTLFFSSHYSLSLQLPGLDVAPERPQPLGVSPLLAVAHEVPALLREEAARGGLGAGRGDPLQEDASAGGGARARVCVRVAEADALVVVDCHAVGAVFDLSGG